MKKIIILLIILLTIIAAIPIVGNKIIEETLDKKINKLESKGIEVLKKEKKAGYLNTSRHYEFIENGTQYGLDLKYSNIPFTEAVSLDIYPLSVPQELLADLKTKDKGFALFLEDFFKNKGILYHMEYNLIDGDFNGYVKNIDEKYTMTNNSQLKVKILGTTFKGNGDLRSPTTIETFSKKINLVVEDVNNHMAIDISNIQLDANSGFSSEKAEIYSKVSFDDIYIKSNNKELNASTFNYDINVTNIDKKAYKEFISSKQSQESVVKLLSKGVNINIKEFSCKKITLNKEDLQGLTLSSDMQLEADNNLAFKMRISPLLALSNLDIDFKSKISKKIVDEIIKESLIPNAVMKHKSISGDDIVFDLYYKQGKLVVNGKTILGS